MDSVRIGDIWLSIGLKCPLLVGFIKESGGVSVPWWYEPNVLRKIGTGDRIPLPEVVLRYKGSWQPCPLN